MLKRILMLLALCIFVLNFAGCRAKNKAGPVEDFYYEVGIASWYGDEHQNKPTASGEIFDKNQMTAAHKTLPFGTWVEVYNLDNGYRAVVKINDREPFVEGEIIDVSERAAMELGMKMAGLARVGINIVSGPPR